MPDGWDDVIASAQRRTIAVRICARGDLTTRHADLVEQLRNVTMADKSLAGDGEATRLAGEIVACEAEIDACAVEVTIGTVSRQVWADLLAEHPPTKEQAARGSDNNPKTFPPALVAACTIEPPMSDEQALDLADKLPIGEWNKLFAAAYTLNVAGLDSPKLEAATALLRASGASSTTPGPAASPEPRSLAGSGEQ